MEGCLDYAFAVYKRRAGTDSNPSIVASITPDGKPEIHWYYRSDQVIATKTWYFTKDDGSKERVDTFEGPLCSLPPEQRTFFGQGRYKVDQDETWLAQHWDTYISLFPRKK